MGKRRVIHHVVRFAFWGGVLGVLVLGIVTWKRQMIAATYADVTKPTPPPPTIVTREQAKAIEKLPEAKVEEVLPKAFNLDVPFVKQAPHGNWDEVHEETCEEASALMVHMYLKKLVLNDDEVEAELQKLIAVQEKLFGYFEDTDAKKTIQFAKVAYGFKNARIIERPTLEDIKKEIFAGRPVLMPADGKALKNPNFRNGGPPYHLILLRGWNEHGFFANDPGTRKGENYYYTNTIISNAIRDWNEEELKANGPRRVFVLTP